MNFPVLYHRGRSGALYQWQVFTKGGTIFTEYGQVGGEKQISEKEAEPKNVGKSNETTPEQQADNEAESMYWFKLERKYFKTIGECEERLVLPMLAPSKEFSETKKDVVYPVSVQPKLDGCRCLAFWESGDIVLLSRGGKPWDLPHIKNQLSFVLKPGDTLDGELYIHGKTFQQITKLIKSKNKAERESIQFHIYDIVDVAEESAPWKLRLNNLSAFGFNAVSAILSVDTHIKIVTTAAAYIEEDVYLLQSDFISQGYEGAMVRTMDGVYEWGYRSKGLLKVKSFDDHEYRIVGFTDGIGKNVGTVKWLCALPNDTVFSCAPTGNAEDRAQMFKDGASYIGKLLKVKHQGFTEEGFPRFPVGLGIRDPQDL
jgi:ATP-dependent DNA ligase